MKVKTHYMLAKIALYKLKNENRIKSSSPLREQLFCIGTILPDFLLTQFIHRHFYEHSGSYVINKIKKLMNRKSLFSALEYGKLAHYLCDFCCSVHRDGKIGNAAEHIRYERGINRFVEKSAEKLKKEKSSGSIFKVPEKAIHSAISKHIEGRRYDIASDVKASLAMCELIGEKAFSS